MKLMLIIAGLAMLGMGPLAIVGVLLIILAFCDG